MQPDEGIRSSFILGFPTQFCTDSHIGDLGFCNHMTCMLQYHEDIHRNFLYPSIYQKCNHIFIISNAYAVYSCQVRLVNSGYFVSTCMSVMMTDDIQTALSDGQKFHGAVNSK